MGYTELIQKLDFKTLSILYKEAENHLNLVNLKKAISDESNTDNLLNLALEDIVFTFEKKSEYNGSNFKQAKYMMITGDKIYSPNNRS